MKEIKTKQEERKEFIASFENGKTKGYDKRVDAIMADRKRQEQYLKYVNIQPKLEEEKYYSR